MKLLKSILYLSLLLVPLIVIVESASFGDNLINITRGSSLSTSSHETSQWVSPSGNIAFGFYPLPCERFSSNCRYVVGIWFLKSPSKTLVWTANRNDLPLSTPSSIQLTNEGKFILQMADNKDAPLIPDVHEAVSYAKMHDDGNFVLYGSDSKILWQSFDHPTDTILSGQKLKDGVDLVSGVSSSNYNSGKYKLSAYQNNGLVAIYRFGRLGLNEEASKFLVSEANVGAIIRKPVTLNLEIGGNLYLVDSDNVVLRVFYEDHTQQHEDDETYIYRATLDPEGHLNFYKERIDGKGDEKSAAVLLWSTYNFWTEERTVTYLLMLPMSVYGILLVGIIGITIKICMICINFEKEMETNGGEKWV